MLPGYQSKSISWKYFMFHEMTLKLFFLFLKYLNFPPDFLIMWENGLIRKERLISKVMTSQTGKQIITTDA